MRGGLVAVLAVLAAGCAAGSVDPGDASLPSEPPPLVAFSAPGLVVPSEPATATSRPVPRGGHLTLPEVGPASAPPASPWPCKQDAFCDDFEEAALGSRWGGATVTGGVLTLDRTFPSRGATALRTTTAGSAALAYLTHEAAPVGAHWAGALGFTMRLDAPPTAALGGPEIVVADALGRAMRIGFSVGGDGGIFAHQVITDDAGSSRVVRSDRVTGTKPREWRRLVVAVEGASAPAPPYGRVEVTVDGAELITLPLVVPAFGGPASVRAGITAADETPAAMTLDDVVFRIH